MPDLVHLHNLTHLGTSVTGTLAEREDGAVPTALELVAALHPTPAVGGVPRTGPGPSAGWNGAPGHTPGRSGASTPEATAAGCWASGR